MRTLSLLACLLTYFTALSPCALRAELKPFADETRYVAVGDSITHRGTYVFYTELFYLTRFPERKIDFFDAGIAGETAEAGLSRVSWDILPTGANAASIMFGMNDVGRDLYKPTLEAASLPEQRQRQIEAFDRDLRSLIKTLQASRISVILITPSIFDETSAMDSPNLPGVNNLGLAACAERIVGIGAELQLPVVDFYQPMLAINREQQQKAPESTIIGKDRIHPGPPGHLLMAWLFLKAQHVPSDVACVSIDGANGKIYKATNCKIEGLSKTESSVDFTYVAHALPFPVEDSAKAALGWAPIGSDLNREIFQITGLAPGNYLLSMDGKPVRAFSAGEFASGVDLSNEPRTPQFQQSQGVLRLLKENWAIVQQLRDIVFVENTIMGRTFPRPLTFEQVKPKLDARLPALTGSSDAYSRRLAEAWFINKPKEAELRLKVATSIEAIRKSAQPVPHLVSLQRSLP